MDRKDEEEEVGKDQTRPGLVGLLRVWDFISTCSPLSLQS